LWRAKRETTMVDYIRNEMLKITIDLRPAWRSALVWRRRLLS
jgi:hypothetical protein